MTAGGRSSGSAQTARQGRAGDRAGSPSCFVTSGRRRQSSAKKNQRRKSSQRSAEAAASAIGTPAAVGEIACIINASRSGRAKLSEMHLWLVIEVGFQRPTT